VSDGRVHYARNGDVRLAYRVFGDTGPLIVWVPGWVVSNVDTYDEADSPYAPLIERTGGARACPIRSPIPLRSTSEWTTSAR
jgi:hypothetical protein